MTAALETQPTPYPGTNAQELFDPSLSTWIYDLRPAQELRRATKYALVIFPGVEPLYGNRATSAGFEGSHSNVRAAGNRSDATAESQ